VVSSTAAGTLRQLVESVVDGVVEKDHRMLPNELESITLLDGSTQALWFRRALCLHYLRDPLSVR
jgi:hypothetical protein